MRYRLMASFRGSPFEAGIGPTDGDIVLFAACPPPEELGFEPATGHWRKQMRISDVQAVWESRPVGRFRGERCMVLDDLGDRLHIGFLGHDGYKAEQLGYWQVDRGVFELVVPKPDVTEVLEEQIQYQPSVAARHQPPPRYPTPADPNGSAPAVTASASTAPASAPPGSTPPGSTAPTSAATTSAADSTPRTSGEARYEPMPRIADTGSWLLPTAAAAAWRPARRSVLDDTTGVALPVTAEAPLPLEAQALKAASESRRARRPAPVQQAAVQQAAVQQAPVQQAPVQQSTAPSAMAPLAPPAAMPLAPPAAMPLAPPAAMPLRTTATAAAARAADVKPLAAPRPEPPGPQVPSSAHAAASDDEQAPERPRRAARRRMATEQLFADLASQAGIPAGSYAVGEEVEGAMCLVETAHGFEVFHCADGARHELQVFASEEAACFYLFGVLAAEAVRTGMLVRGSVTSPV